eukprot:358525-Chlamydomonas_euryale.AAC.2
MPLFFFTLSPTLTPRFPAGGRGRTCARQSQRPLRAARCVCAALCAARGRATAARAVGAPARGRRGSGRRRRRRGPGAQPWAAAKVGNDQLCGMYGKLHQSSSANTAAIHGPPDPHWRPPSSTVHMHPP